MHNNIIPLDAEIDCSKHIFSPEIPNITEATIIYIQRASPFLRNNYVKLPYTLNKPISINKLINEVGPKNMIFVPIPIS